MDPSVGGREITRPYYPRKLTASAPRDLAQAGAPRADELRAFAERIEGKLKAGTGPAGNRHYWRSDYMIHRRRDYYASVRMHSTRTLAYEIVNREGLRSYYRSDGFMQLVRNGKEYDAIYPTWNWRMLPGVTCAVEGKGWPNGDRRGKTDFVGGVSDGTLGAAAMHLDRNDVTARKAWFFLDGEIVCLGAGINSAKDAPIVTTVNQCLLRGKVTLHNPADVIAKPNATKKGIVSRLPTTVHHDGLAYWLKERQRICLSALEQTGGWHRINRRHKSEKITREIFTLWIDHGKKPRDATYAYTIFPGAKADKPPQPRAEILANTPSRQAVRDAKLGITQVVFHEAGELADGELTLRVDKPCIVQLTGDTLAVADPTQRLRVITVTVNGKGHRIELARGPQAGRSTIVRLK
jgi:chondroitin AC lyase